MPKVVGLITARGGSKALPRKNVLDLAGKPLIAWTVEAALRARNLDRVVLSTDDHEIATIAKRFGAEVPFIRPAELAQDKSTHVDVLLHAIEWMRQHENYQPEYVLTLQPTSPFRLGADIDGAIALAWKRQAEAVVSVCESLSHPFRIKRMDDKSVLREFFAADTSTTLRQGWPTAYWTNGAIYLNRIDCFLKSRTMFPPGMLGYEMPVARSMDIDTEWDLRVANLIMREIENAHRRQAA